MCLCVNDLYRKSVFKCYSRPSPPSSPLIGPSHLSIKLLYSMRETLKMNFLCFYTTKMCSA